MKKSTEKLIESLGYRLEPGRKHHRIIHTRTGLQAGVFSLGTRCDHGRQMKNIISTLRRFDREAA